MAGEENKVDDEQARHVFTHVTNGLELAFYPDGQERLAALLALIDNAQTSLKLAYYIFATDRTSAVVRDRLADAQKRGVAVTLILDAFGSKADEAFLAPLISAGGMVLKFQPRWNVRYLIRNHQKIAIADDRRAMIGGFNIEDSYFDPPEKDGWNDLGITLEGDAVGRLVEWFAGLREWTADPDAQFLAIRRLVREWQPGEGKVRWLMGGPTHWLNSWARCVLMDVDQGSRLSMMMAYFSPRVRIVERLGRLAERGEACFVLAGKSDNGATIGAARSLYSKLLGSGATIYEYDLCKLHTKLIVVDDAVYVGSANFDMRSLYLNLELMLRIEDAELAEKLRRFIAAQVPSCVHVTQALHSKRKTWRNWLRWLLSWLLVGVIDYTVTRRLNLGLKG
jgi:cardiolipin synthase